MKGRTLLLLSASQSLPLLAETVPQLATQTTYTHAHMHGCRYIERQREYIGEERERERAQRAEFGMYIWRHMATFHALTQWQSAAAEVAGAVASAEAEAVTATEAEAEQQQQSLKFLLTLAGSKISYILAAPPQEQQHQHPVTPHYPPYSLAMFQ